MIAPPQSLEHRDGRLWCGSQPIDLVYNRLTDFSLDEPADAALRSAYLSGDVVLTPNPWSHAMYADKRNLVRLTDAETLERWGVEEKLSAIVRDGIPKTVLLSPGRSDELWSMRNKLFFKPAAGFGGRAAYRGDKITRRVWQSILEGGLRGSASGAAERSDRHCRWALIPVLRLDGVAGRCGFPRKGEVAFKRSPADRNCE